MTYNILFYSTTALVQIFCTKLKDSMCKLSNMDISTERLILGQSSPMVKGCIPEGCMDMLS